MRIKTLFIPVALFIGIAAPLETKAATPAPKTLICRDNTTGAINLRLKKCKNSETVLSNFSQLKGDTGATGATGPSGLIAAIKVTNAGALASQVLGSEVSALTPSYLGSGIYQIDIAGNFSTLTSADSTANKNKIIVLPAVVAGSNSVVDYQLVTATSTAIRIWVYTFRSDNGTALQSEISVGVFLGS